MLGNYGFTMVLAFLKAQNQRKNKQSQEKEPKKNPPDTLLMCLGNAQCTVHVAIFGLHVEILDMASWQMRAVAGP